MTPADQTITGLGGDCWAACIATVLDLPRADVPHFVNTQGPEEERGDALWYRASRAWLQEHTGLDLWAYTPDDIWPPREAFADLPADTRQLYALASGQSPRGDWLHGVVIDLDGHVVHDPHPARAGVVGPFVDYMVLAPPDDDMNPLHDRGEQP